jgi:hypothetical protein
MELIINCSFIYIFLVVVMMFLVSKMAVGKLFKGEEIRMVENYPVMMKFIPGEKNKPLVVLSPGANSTARIFYGVQKGTIQGSFYHTGSLRRGIMYWPFLTL